MYILTTKRPGGGGRGERSWSFGSWIYNYLCYHCRWFSPVSFTNKTDRRNITEILLEVALNTITLAKA